MTRWWHATRKVKGSPKSRAFILRASWISVPNEITICLIVRRHFIENYNCSAQNSARKSQRISNISRINGCWVISVWTKVLDQLIGQQTDNATLMLFQLIMFHFKIQLLPDDNGHNLQNCLIQTLAEVDQSASIGSHSAQHYSWIEEKTHTKQLDKSINHTPTAMLSTNYWGFCRLVFQCSPRGSTTRFKLNYAEMWVFQDFNYAITYIYAFVLCVCAVWERVCAASMPATHPLWQKK